ncbi:unnamed protein product [Blepharisma stoltei]|uniref:THAP4-like heme-binding domain-containing protein n=1 Tax=Blepharisma stoltei TaxID=1481888 RepID=A0AAU9IAA0_9CILI|nr:unnamed protein product [Blepharisma stoltei]
MGEFLRFIGKWSGSGYVLPPINVNYGEEISITPFGTPKGIIYNFSSKTWIAGSDYQTRPMHTEIGMMKLRNLEAGNFAVELMLTHPFGLCEVDCGQAIGSEILLESTNFIRTPTNTNIKIDKVRRRYWLEGDTLKYQLYLTVFGGQENLHLQGELTRVTEQTLYN